MLRVYARHYPPCTQTDGGYRRCHCPKWINGTLPTGEFLRFSAKTRSWETAERKARLREANADPLRSSPPDAGLRITIVEAVRSFLQDEEARQLAKTTSQSKTLFQHQLLTWAKTHSLTFLDELTTARLREFRSSWNNGSLTSQRKHHRLNGFFNFCMENEWLTRNPSKKMKAVHATLVPTDYFTPVDFEQIIDGTYAYGEWKGGRDFHHRALRLRALILLMRWSGLSILDAVTLERQRLQGHRLLLYRHKNPWDNAACESFMKTLKYEEVYRNEYRDLAEARASIGEFLEKVYNQKRLHSALGYVPPSEFEAQLAVQNVDAAARQLSL